jgi:hypothetical protein
MSRANLDEARTAQDLSPVAERVDRGRRSWQYPAGIRYLTLHFAVGALRRGNGIEQFLGGVDVAGVAAIRWVAISPTGEGYLVSVHTAEDLDGQHADLAEFPSVDPADEEYVGQGRALGHMLDEREALQLAEQMTGAASDRWVNFGVAGEEYLDYVRGRRLATG